MKKVILLLALCVLVLRSSYAQDSLRAKPGYLHSGKIGLGIDGITASPNLLMKYFFNNQFAIQLIVGVNVDIPGGSAPANQTKVSGLTLRGGVSLLFHLVQNEVSPYIGVEGVFQYAKAGGFFTTTPDPKNSIVASGVMGAEYFMSERFAIGIKQSLGAGVMLKRDVPKEETEITLSTSTVVTGRFYFN